MKVICWLKTVWYTAISGQFWLGGYPIMGHDYVEQENEDLLCSVCGDRSSGISKKESSYYDKL